ncbi:peroxisomal multifunctional enzyme type 2 [Westerdykella ornata]|uniref:Peroxisomal multifunctional enzyme type 2 n=1 Tax=Westerdykella ornata TaxID=318751 RepID=A0A6A6JVN8_WESOR|nr:peroxisomal multifunctional enzyme type 2 [Westerdykella ornata]KAF2280295.1 peroxisomal multifunctional enzyme type 2 [Westerdykella ornata]
MSGPGVGFEYPPIPVSWLKRDVLLFAASIGVTEEELHFLYELHPNFQPFPTYPIILPFKHTDQEVIDFYARSSAVPIPGVPKFDTKHVLDGERKIQFLKPIPPTSAGRSFEIRSKVLGVYDKGKPGTVVETEQCLVDKETGEVYTRAVGSGFYVGQGNWGGPKGPKTQNYPPPKDRKPDASQETQTTGTTALLYRLNGDYNPLHAGPEPGKQMGFGGPIIHGLFSWNTAAHAVLQHFGGSDPRNLKEFQARFASPVIPGVKLITDIWRTGEKVGSEGFEEIRFIVRVEGGKTVLTNGRAVVRVVGEKSKL